ncbi:MAG TPA: acyl-CoA dehydrogenase [Dehalococcoidia bacterium]|nr:acyl-CoA dehydrogenase [Dehalococcoidia bacterium]
MDFKFTEEQAMFQQAIRDFCSKEIAPLVDEAEARERFPVELFPRAAKYGYLCIRAPQELGGAGMDKVSECIWNEEVARVSLGIAESLYIGASFVTPHIWENGTEAQKQKYVVPSIRGEKISAFGLTEPQGGSNPAANESTAIRKGDKYILNGSKIFITNGSIADFIMVFAYTDKSKGPREGMSSFIVERGMPGFTSKKMSKAGSKASDEAELYFDDVELPLEYLVGEEGKGYRYALWLVGINRISHAARGLGVSQCAFEAALDYAKQRVVWGQPIGKNQALSFRLGEMAIAIESTRQLVYKAAWLHDQEDQSWPQFAAMAKYLAAQTAARTADLAIQVYGVMA